MTGGDAKTLLELRAASWGVAQWQKLLAVHVEQGDALGSVGMPLMLGTYRVRDKDIQFEPQFPLEPGLRYVAAFYPERLPGSAGGPIVSATFQLPRREATPSTVVTRIFPTADTLPENLLKFYVHFSAPMSRGHIYDHIHLRNAAGKDVELPFLEIDEELWNPQMTRLTLFIDPGRIKRGVRPLEEIGPSLEQGQRYTLWIDSAWQDANGVGLKESFRKAFLVGPDDREPVNPGRWNIQPPQAGTREPLTVLFPEPLDHALAQRVIRVVDGRNRTVEGTITLADQERRWNFAPAKPWLDAVYAVSVQKTIEDLAGNNIGKTFEVDLFEGVEKQFTNSTIQLPFTPR